MRAVTVCGLLLIAGVSDAGAQRTITLQDAAAAALTQHASLIAAASAVARAQANVREAGASLLPALTLDASLNRFEEPMVVAPLHGFDPRNPPRFDELLAQGAVSLGYTVFDGGARRARVARADALLASARAAEETVRQSLLVDVVRSYTAVLLARELDGSHRARLAALEQERSRAARLLEQGRAARVVLLRAEAAVSAARAEQVAAQGYRDGAERELARVTGITPAEVSAAALPDVRPVQTPITRDSALSAALARSSEMQRVTLQLDAARSARSEAASQWWPRLNLGGRYTRYGSGLGDVGGEWQAGMQLTYALFTAGARPAAQDRAQAEIVAAQAERALAQDRIAAAVDAAMVALESAHARTDAWHAAVTQFEEVARIERLALDTGAGIQADYLTAEAELLRARAARAEARYGELISRAELARAMGVLSLDWLARNVESRP